MKLEQARKIVDFVVAEAPGAVSVFVADAHGEIVAAATMDGAAPDTRLNAQRKAYTAARSDATATSALAEKVKDDPVERASFDPYFTFFKGGVAAYTSCNTLLLSASATPTPHLKLVKTSSCKPGHDKCSA